MEATLEKVRRAVRRELVDADADLELLPSAEVCGHVISRDFAGLDYDARHRLLIDLLERHLEPREMRRLGALLTYTPEEWSVSLEDVGH